MKKLLTLLLIFELLSCSQKEHNTDLLLSNKIQGDWKKSELIFTFQDSTCSYLYPGGEFSKYKLIGDTLNISKKTENRKNYISDEIENYKFLIDKITKNSLFLIPITPKTKNLFKNYKNEKADTIKLSRILKQNNLTFKRLGFYSTGCFGTCPAMYLEIDSIGNFLFNGTMFTEKSGSYKGKLSKIKFDLISNKINNIQLDSLKKFYSANWTDDQTCGIKIKMKDSTYESSAYGFDKEPIELRILFHSLMELYKNVELKKDSTVNEKFKFKEFQFSAYPSIPPPPFPTNYK